MGITEGFDIDNAAPITLVRGGANFPAVVFPNLQVGIISQMEYFPGGGSLQVIVMVGKVVNGAVASLDGLRLGKDFQI